jgi:hypothetical protein
MAESDAPKGLKNSAQGFNPGNPSQNRFALKGREMRPPDESRTILPRHSQSKLAVRRLGLYFHLVRRFDLAPIQGAALWVVSPKVETLG